MNFLRYGAACASAFVFWFLFWGPLDRLFDDLDNKMARGDYSLFRWVMVAVAFGAGYLLSFPTGKLLLKIPARGNAARLLIVAPILIVLLAVADVIQNSGAKASRSSRSFGEAVASYPDRMKDWSAQDIAGKSLWVLGLLWGVSHRLKRGAKRGEALDLGPGIVLSAWVEANAAGLAPGHYEALIDESGLLLRDPAKGEHTVPVGGELKYLSKRRISAQIDGKPVAMRLAKNTLYCDKLGVDLVKFINGLGEPPSLGDYTVPRYLVLLALLPLGVPAVTLGGALFGAIGGVLTCASFAAIRVEGWSNGMRVTVCLAIAAAGYIPAIVLRQTG